MILAVASGLVLTGCATDPLGDPVAVARINAIMRTPARTETEMSDQRARRELREQAFGEKIGLLSEKDAYDPPRLVRYVTPRLPAGYNAGGPSPSAEVAVIIDINGHVSDTRIVSAASPILVEPALDAVRKWRFTPGRKDHQLIGMSFILPVDFRVN